MTPSPFAAWTAFYTITGSSAAALTGLMFVVVSLAANGSRDQDGTRAGFAVFSTPTVVHLGAAFVLSAALTAPWRAAVHAGLTAALIGLCGVIYMVTLIVRMRQLTTYATQTEEWIWYATLPGIAYALVALSGLLVPALSVAAPIALAIMTLLLIAIGIHNAWDIVTYLAIERAER